MILNRVMLLAPNRWLALIFTLVLGIVLGIGGFPTANGQSARPRNSLRQAPRNSKPALPRSNRIAPGFTIEQNFYRFHHDRKIDFKLHCNGIADLVVTDQQLAKIVLGNRSDRQLSALTQRPQSTQRPPSVDIIYDSAVQPAAYNDAATEGFSAFSNVEIATLEEPTELRSVEDQKKSPVQAVRAPADLETPPSQIPASAPTQARASTQTQPPASPSPVQAPIGPAFPADLALDLPISRQMIGDLQEVIQHQKAVLKSSQNDETAEHSRRARLLDESLGLLSQAKKYLKKDLIQRDSIMKFEEKKKLLQNKLSVDLKPQIPNEGESAEDLFTQLESLRQDMETLHARMDELNKTELQHKVRLGEIPKDRADSRKGIAELDKQLKNEELGEADTFTMIRLRAEELQLEYHTDSLDSESKLYEMENRLLPLNSDLLARELKVLEAEIEAWNFAANRRRRLDLEQEARVARAQVIDAAPALRELAELNAELTQRRISFTELIRAATDEEIEVKGLLNDVHGQHEAVEKSIIDNTLSQADGLLLVDVRRKMIRPFKSRQRIRQLNRELQKISLERIKLNELREPLSHPVEYAAEILQDVHSDSITDAELSVMAVEIVESIRQQYDQLSADHHAYIDLLGRIIVEREELVREIDATMQFVNQNSLWVRSAQPISIQQIARSRFAVAKFFSPQLWTELLGELTHRFVTSPHESAGGLIGLVGLFIFSRRFKA